MKKIFNKSLKFNSSMFISNNALKIYSTIACILIGLIIGLICLICMSPGDAFYEFGTLITGGIQYNGIVGFFDVLAFSAPLICCGLCVLFAYKTGLFNIGAAGQYTMGAFGALLFAIQFHAHWTVCILFAAIFGALWACIPALLKSFCHVNEVISGIMCNWISLFFVNYSFQTYLSSCVDSKVNKTYNVLGHSALPSLGLQDTLGKNFSISIIIALLLVIIIHIIINKTTLGYQLKASGLNKDATRYAGMNDKRNLIITMAIAGALAGIGAALFYLANLEQWQPQQSSSLPGMPWNGIVVAFVAQLSPIGSLFVAIFITLIFNGAKFMTQTIFPAEIGDLITGIIVYTSGLVAILRIFISKIIENKRKTKMVDANSETPIENSNEKGGKENA